MLRGPSIPRARRWRVAWYATLVTLPVAGMGVLAAVYLRSALRHRSAVELAAREFTAGLLREVIDRTDQALAGTAVPLFRRAREVEIRYAERGTRLPGPAVVEAVAAIMDSTARCACPRYPARAVGYWDRSSGALELRPADDSVEVRRLLASVADSPRLAGLDAVGVTSRPGERAASLVLLPSHPAQSRAGALVLVVDLERLAAMVQARFDTVTREQLPRLTDPERTEGADLVVIHPSGPLAPGTAGPRFGWVSTTGESTPAIDLEGQRILFRPAHVVDAPWQATMPSRDGGAYVLRLAVTGALLAQVIPGGMPGSPWPLAAGAVLLSLVLAVLALLTLRRFERLVRLREQFVSGVTHELRTPIAQILAYGETLQLELPAPESKRRAAAVIVREARRLSRLVENALAFASGRRPGVALDPQELDLAEEVTGLADEVRPLVSHRGGHLTVRGEPGIRTVVDHAALRQMVSNLVENAVIHGPDQPDVVIAVSQQDGMAAVVVSDNGPGVPPEDRERIWEPFARGRLARDGTGTGLGLSIVRQLAELHGGTAAVEGNSTGARFVIRLPLARTP